MAVIVATREANRETREIDIPRSHQQDHDPNCSSHQHRQLCQPQRHRLHHPPPQTPPALPLPSLASTSSSSSSLSSSPFSSSSSSSSRYRHSHRSAVLCRGPVCFFCESPDFFGSSRSKVEALRRQTRVAAGRRMAEAWGFGGGGHGGCR